MAPHHRPRKESRPRETPIALRLIQIRERTIGSRFVQPGSHALEDSLAGLGRCDGGGLELPVGFGVEVAGVEGELRVGFC